MNTFVKIEFDEKEDKLLDQVSQSLKNESVAACVCGFTTLSQAKELNDQVRAISQVAFYCVNSSGLYGFCYADIGSDFEYQYANSDPDKKE